jgi:oligoendopeptidase F
MYTAAITKTARNFVPAGFVVTNWESIEPFYKNLTEREITTPADMEQWLKDTSELEAVISEDACWRQIKMTCDTENKALEEAFNYFCMELQPKIQPYADELNKKLVNHPLTQQLDADKYFTYLRSVRKSIELFKEENIPLQAELAVMQQQYGVTTGKMTVDVEGKEYTLQQAAKYSSAGWLIRKPLTICMRNWLKSATRWPPMPGLIPTGISGLRNLAALITIKKTATAFTKR